MATQETIEALARKSFYREYPDRDWDDLLETVQTVWVEEAKKTLDFLQGLGFGDVAAAKREALEELITEDSLEDARFQIEEELVGWRDAGLFTLRRNGLSIRNKDGSGSEIIRFGFEDGFRQVIRRRLGLSK